MLEIIHHESKEKRHDTPILFVHGAWHGAWCWEEHFLPYFAQNGYDAYAVSLRGHGGSAGPKRLSWVSTADYVADVAEVAQSLPVPPIVVGHSMGGFVVQKYLAKYFALAGVLLASIPPKPILGASYRVIRHAPLRFLQVNLQLDLYPLVSTPELAQHFFFSAGMEREKVEAYHGRLQSESYRTFMDMLGFALPRPKQVKTPLLVLGAERDTVISVQDVKGTAAAYNTQAKLFPNMAHDMMLEDGWQGVADTILGWLDKAIGNQ